MKMKKKKIWIVLVLCSVLGIGTFIYYSKQDKIEDNKLQSNKNINEEIKINENEAAEDVPKPDTLKLDVKRIQLNNLEKLKFSKIVMGDVDVFYGRVGDDFVAITVRGNLVTHITITPYDTREEVIPSTIKHMQFADIYHNNEVAVSDSEIVNGVPDYENIRRIVFDGAGTIKSETKPHDDTAIIYFQKICNLITKLY